MKNNNSKDPLDQEVDELLKLAKSKKFKRGIYNYCDRWCERCQDTEKCFLYARETQEKTRNVMNNKEEDWVEEIEYNFEITKRLIERNLKEEGIDYQAVLKEKPEKSWDDNAEWRYDKVPCLISAKKYEAETERFLNRFYQGHSLYLNGQRLQISYQDVRDEIETITWYHTFLPIKIWRTLYERESWQKEKDPEMKSWAKRDVKKFYQLVLKCLNQSKKAWQNLAAKRKELNQESQQFISRLEKIQTEFAAELREASIF